MNTKYGMTEWLLGTVAIAAFLITLGQAIGCQIAPSVDTLINDCETDMQCELAEMGMVE